VLTVYDEGRDTAAIGIEARRYVAAPCNSSESGIGSPWLQYGYRRIMARVFHGAVRLALIRFGTATCQAT
jgi:hypothetical protein